MNEKQIKEYEKLSKLKEQYERFIERDGHISISYYSDFIGGTISIKVDDNDFKDLVKTLAKERLENINKQIEEL